MISNSFADRRTVFAPHTSMPEDIRKSGPVADFISDFIRQISLDNAYFPEVVIELYRYDGDECLAVVDGEPVSFVQRSDVVDLIEAVHGIVLNE